MTEPTSTTATPTSIHDVVIIPAVAPTETPEPTPAEMKATIARLESELQANRQRGKQEKIDQPDGSTKAASTLSTEIKAEIENWHLVGEQARRQREELASAQPQYKYQSPALCPTAEDVEKLIGRTRFAKMTPEQRAKARDVRQADVDALNVHEYIGKGSNSGKANQLGLTNPVLYALLKKKAKDEGIF